LHDTLHIDLRCYRSENCGNLCQYICRVFAFFSWLRNVRWCYWNVSYMESTQIVRRFLSFARRRTDTVAPSIMCVKATTFPSEYSMLSKRIFEKHTICSSLIIYLSILVMQWHISECKWNIFPIIKHDIKMFYYLYKVVLFIIVLFYYISSLR